ncbi:exodeoxyribonuclease III [Frigoriflavimonas asaccharolytica]|uniref:Exodeoxyribonuclease-3 n=1 Tax=Frigoriflavimonas asaccharolytica TaxID=2735899 RepID=A0A8J8G6Q3_9FLAO|nr:exodeoxyribonuclease III [Frigoriflavimonas asaccharolytica]NRS91700.1 exodeoxyribonuclease-3 [Frigoriflavimonas asaccharolytica]
MKIITYNVNGIRAAFTKDFLGWLQVANPDVICIQESKAGTDQIDIESLEKLGYFSTWHSAQKKGYSGVGIASKIAPKHIEIGCGIERYDFEGRIMRADFENFSVLSVYVPSASNIDRLEFKMEFCEDFLLYIQNLKEKIPNLIICGDFNICHEEIDIHNPKMKNVSGFLPMERDWMTRFLGECKLTDTFRYLHPEKQQFSWWSYRAGSRAKNLGWRLDYHFVTEAIKNKMTRTVILNEAVHSDHCPVMMEFEND